MKAFVILTLALVTNSLFGNTWEFRTGKSVHELNQKSWQKFPLSGNPIKREYEGYIEYKTMFNSKENLRNTGLYLGLIGDADKTYVNGVQVGKSGNFPPDFSYNMDTERNYYLPDGLIKKGSNSIRVLVYSKFLVNKGLNPKSFKVAPASELDHNKYAEELKNNLFKIIIPVLCLVLTVVSFPLLAPKHLWNSQFMIFLIGLSSFVLGICRGRSGYHFWDMLIVYKATLISSVLTIWLVTIFMTRSCKSWLRFMPSFISALLITAILASDTLIAAASWGRVWFHISPIFLLVALYGNLRTSGLKSLRSLGLIVLIATNLNDNLNDLRIISTVSLLQFGLGMFISLMIIDQLLGLKRSWEKYFMKEAELEIDAATGRQAFQIAHDLRSPIESIKVGLNNLKSSGRFDDISIELGLKRMYEICDSLLKKNNIEIHTHSFTDINKAVSELISEFRHTHDRTQIFYHSSGPASEVRHAFSFDLPMLKRTICNLINNSIEASHGSANIWITTSLEENFLKISVQDEGAGIQGNTLEMFERGFTTKPNGNGLGLSGAKQFIESNGGMITINKLEKGTLVNLMIPSSSTTQYFELTTEQIVLIDDDPLVRFNWKRQGQKKNIIVNAFDSLDTFLAKKDLFPTNTPIFIDSNLGTEKGEILSKRLYDLGFEDIVLTTAAPKNSIIETKWISSIVGKCFESALNSRRSSPNLGAFYID
jgi:signal transduction histidine kinase